MKTNYSATIFFLVTFLFLNISYSQAPSIEWQISLGGTGEDTPANIIQTTDGGYIVAGSTTSSNGYVSGHHGSYDYWIVKLSSTGIMHWQKSLGGTSGDILKGITETTDGGYIVSGSSSSNDGDVSGNHGGEDYWIVKLSSIGIIEWQKSLGGTAGDGVFNLSNLNKLQNIIQTTDGGYIVAGDSFSNDGDVTGNHGNKDYWIVKLSTTGIIEWQKCLGGTSTEEVTSIIQTTDGGYIVAGNSGSNDGDATGNHGNYDYWIVKLSSVGIIEWQKSLGGTSLEKVANISQTIDGGYIVGGKTESNNGDVTGNHGNGDYWIVKLSSVGIIEWKKCLGGTSVEEVVSISQTTDGGYIVAGNSSSNDGDVTGNHQSKDFWIVKLSTTGIIEWQKSLGGTYNEYVVSIFQTTDGGYVVAGDSNSIDGDVTGNHGSSDYWIVRLSATGVIQWQKSLGGSSYESITKIIETTDGGYIVAGYSNSNDGDTTKNRGGRDYWIVKLSSESLSTTSFLENNSLTIFPNPVDNEIYLKSNDYSEFQVSVYSLLGQEIISKISLSNNNSVNVASLHSGIYLLKVKAKDGNTQSIKFIKN